tara:strand:+ start:243 stop:731 length:489 start_codon:yes stop_codon:yes gene_type:complete
MHGKKVYINKSKYSIQGLKTVSNSLPGSFKKILKKGGHNYSSIINNWSSLVGKKISNVCYPKAVKSDKELKNGTLVLNVFHGDQILVEYSKGDIIDKINTFFGYKFLKDIKLVLIKEKISKEIKDNISKDDKIKWEKSVQTINNSNLKKNLLNLINTYNKRK